MGFVYNSTKGKTYYLNTKETQVKGGRIMAFYFFTLDERPETACELPEGREVVENPRNGFPVLRKKVS